MVVKYASILVCLFYILGISTMQAQQIGLRIHSFPGVATNSEAGYFYDGGGLDFYYQHKLGQGRIEAAAEFRMINWGNQAAVNLGYNLQYWAKNQWRVSGTTSVQMGGALFQQKSLFVWGLEYIPQIEWQSNKRFNASLGIGFRYTNCPAYSQYSKINSTYDIPIRLGFGFRLIKDKSVQAVD